MIYILIYFTMQNNELAKVNPQGVALATVDEKSLRDYLFGLKDPLTEKQQNLFLGIAKANNLNPFKREIYAVWFGDNFSIITGYQVYIDKANATGLLNWWKVETIRDDKWELKGARVIIYRKGWDMPFEWEVSLSEFAKQRWDKDLKKKVLMKNWAEMPEFMIKKVVIGQGFRLCFPSELWSLPYLAEEITPNNEKDVIEGQIVEVEVDEPEDETPTQPAPAEVVPDQAQETEPAQEVVPDAPSDQPITSNDVEDVFRKLPANKVKQVQIKWKEFAEKSKWNFEESEKKRKATLKKYFNVESTNDLTVEQADEFVAKINQAIEKITY